MSRFIFLLLLVFFYSTLSFSQAKYYVATGKDSITYVATNEGLLILKRDINGELHYHSKLEDPIKIYTRALDNDNYLALATSDAVDLYSLVDKYRPGYIGSINNIANLVSIRPFGNYFAVICATQSAGFSNHYIVGVENDSAKILTVISENSITYSKWTAWYPEVVYPYFFTKYTDSQVVLYTYSDSLKAFEFKDTIKVVSDGFKLVQMYGAKENLFVYENKYMSNYEIHYRKFRAIQDNLYYMNQTIGYSNFPFTDEIECSDKLIRFNGSYKLFTGHDLIHQNGNLSSYTNLSGNKIYGTRFFSIPSYSKMYYSSKIENTTIYSAEFICDPTAINDGLDTKYFSLSQNYPNPFNPVTVIHFQIAAAGNVSVHVFDCLGREIKKLLNEYKNAGEYTVEFNVNNLPSGVYFYKIISGSFSETKKMILLR